SGDGGAPEATQPAAYSFTAFSPRGAVSSSVTDGESILPATTCGAACALLGPADVMAVPPARNVMRFVPSCRRGIVATVGWQTVRQLTPAFASAPADASKRSQYCWCPFTGSVTSIPAKPSAPALCHFAPW